MCVKNISLKWYFILLSLPFLGIESMAHEWMAPSLEAKRNNPFEIFAEQVFTSNIDGYSKSKKDAVLKI